MKPSPEVTAYIKAAPRACQPLLRQLRAAIREAAPEATEGISYGLPAYKQEGVLVYFGGFKDHVSLFPTGSGVQAFGRELRAYKTSRGTVQLPFDAPLPLGLVRRIVAYRLKENRKK